MAGNAQVFHKRNLVSWPLLFMTSIVSFPPSHSTSFMPLCCTGKLTSSCSSRGAGICWGKPLSGQVKAHFVKLSLSSLSDRSPYDVIGTSLPCKRSHLKRETHHLNLMKISQNCENQQFRIPPKIRNSRLWEIRVIVQASILLLGRGGEPVLIYTDCRKKLARKC